MSAEDDFPDYTPEEIDKAFWLQDYLFRNGLKGIHFSRAGRRWAVRNGSKTVARELRKNLK